MTCSMSACHVLFYNSTTTNVYKYFISTYFEGHFDDTLQITIKSKKGVELPISLAGIQTLDYMFTKNALNN